MSSTFAVWALTGALLLLAAVIAVVGYVWATTSNLDRLTEADVLAMLRDDDEFAWPALHDAELEAKYDYIDGDDDDRPTARELADDDLPIFELPPERAA